MIACDKENKERVDTALKDLSSLASKGSDIAQEVAAGFKEIEQAVYKVSEYANTFFRFFRLVYRSPHRRKITCSLF